MPARPVIELSTYVLEALRKDAEFILYRGRRENDGSRLLLATPVEEHPRPESLKLLDHAYTFEEELDAAWAARPIAITRYWDRPVLVMEDPGGVPLDQLLGQPLDIELSLRLAVSLSKAIDQLHRRGIVHKDIKPAHILANADEAHRGRLWVGSNTPTGAVFQFTLPVNAVPVGPLINLVNQKTLSVEDSAGDILFEVVDRLCLGRNEAFNQITDR
jgi:serine/threonine protein kinase